MVKYNSEEDFRQKVDVDGKQFVSGGKTYHMWGFLVVTYSSETRGSITVQTRDPREEWDDSELGVTEDSFSSDREYYEVLNDARDAARDWAEDNTDERSFL